MSQRSAKRAFLLFRLPWILLATLLVVASTLGALYQSPRPDPFEPVRILSWDWLAHPAERNAFERLPAIWRNVYAISIMSDGQKGWAVGEDGVIRYTADGGLTWRLQPSRSDASLYGIEILPDGERGWVVGESGTILHTADAGRNWQRQDSGTDVWLYGIEMLPDGQRGFAVGQYGTILHTTDGGLAWQQQPLKTNAWLYATDALADGQGWAVGSGGTILYTADGGLSWQPQSSQSDASLWAVMVLPDGERGWAVGRSGTILRTTDGGQSWQRSESDTDATLYGIEMLPDGRQGWAVGSGGIVLHTLNGGLNWQPQNTRTNAWFRAVELLPDGKRGWAVGEGGAILHTRDGGQNWQPQTGGTEARLFDVQLLPDGERGWAVSEGGVILRTTDGGLSWRPQIRSTEVRLLGAELLPPEGEQGWVVGERGIILHTADGGLSWQQQPSGTSVSLYAIEILPDGQQGWVVGESGIILHTVDAGRNWQRQNSPTDALLRSVQMLKGERGWGGWVVGDAGTILHTTDDGLTWQPRPSSTDNSLRSVQMLADGQQGWLVGDAGTIRHTTDGGVSWQAQNSGTDARLLGVQMLPDGQQGWLVGDAGTILHTTDGGVNWQIQDSGTDARLLRVQTLDGERGLIAGVGGNILSTTDGGLNWHRLPYERNPGPWVYLMWIAGAFCVVASARRPLRSEPEALGIADQLASDRPLSPEDPDPLGYRRIAAGLSRFLRNEKTEPPLTVAITGEWGTGKSSLMNLLRGDLERHRFRPVWFNAWHHQKERHLFAAVLEAVRSQAVPPWWSLRGLGFRGRLLSNRTRAYQLWTVLILAVFGVSLGITAAKWQAISAAVWSRTGVLWADFATEEPVQDGTTVRRDDDTGAVVEETLAVEREERTIGAKVADLAGELLDDLKAISPLIGLVPAIVGVWVAVRNRLASWQLSPAKLMASLGDRMQVKDLDAQLGFRHRFANAFREVCEALRPRTMVIIIDDLDRCRPEQVVETLEAVNFLVTAGPCYVILGIAPEQVMRCVGLGFREIAHEMSEVEPQTESDERTWRRRFAQSYLEKLINLEVQIPKLTDEDARHIAAESGERQQLSALAKGLARMGFRVVCAALFIGAILVGAQVSEWPKDDMGEIEAPIVAGGTERVDTQETTPPEPAPPPQRPEEQAKARPVEKVKEWKGATAEPPSWSWQAPWASLVILIGVVLLIQVLRHEDPVVRDSPEFARALDIWVPLVVTRTRSPRAVKRFVNRVRYYAMSELPPEPTVSLWERLRRLAPLGKAKKTERAAYVPLPEQLLVALGAIQQWRPEALSAASSETLKGMGDEAVATALEKHAGAFGGFEVSNDGLERFREIAAGVTTR